jgi:2'-5' RNA ligase
VSNLVIVAIPDENDRVWKVSSEPIPHLTLLFLGESGQVDNLDKIVQFTEHAADTTLQRFYLPVDRRGELGEDSTLGPADVLFFKKNRYDFKAVSEFRSVLLKDNAIKTAYDSASQHDGPWLPHLTLGYENRPAKKPANEDDYPFYDVSFNKIAVWDGDYTGPEFLLKDFWDEYDALESVPLDVAMSGIMHHDADPVDQRIALGTAFLAHYGVKGMRWGVRNDKGGNNTSGQGETKREGIQKFLDPTGHSLANDTAKTAVGVFVPIVAPLTWPAQIRLVRGAARGAQAKALDSQEKRFAKNAMSPKNFAAIHNGSVDKANQGIAALDKKYPDVSKPATKKKYDDEVLKVMQDAYKESANSLTNKANTMHLDVEFHNDGKDVKIHARQGSGTPQRVQHSVEDDLANEEITVEITGKIKRDATGHIVGIVFDDLEHDASAQHSADLDDSVTHSTMDLGAEFIAGLGLKVDNDLEHYGVKGMRWGVRRDPPEAVTPTASSVVPHGNRRKTKIAIEGGQNHEAHPDALKVAEAKAKLKKSGVAALSNSELKDMQTRLNLETQVAQLTSNRGQKFIQRQLEQTGQQTVQAGRSGLAKKIVKKGGKAAGVAAILV